MPDRIKACSGPARRDIAPLFAGWDSCLVRACLQGEMGQAWALGTDSAQLLLGDFCFFAGRPRRALAKNCHRDTLILVPLCRDWDRLLQALWGPALHPGLRYALQSPPADFFRARLPALARCPSGFSLAPINERLFHMARAQAWSADLCSQFPDYAAYRARGLGFAVLDGQGRLAAGASSYARDKQGIEIQVDCALPYRRRGLATACSARLILACLDMGLHPGWDAQNPASLALAEKLGYRFSHSYPIFELKK